MTRQTDNFRQHIETAWKALSDQNASEEGWRSIALPTKGPCSLLAGRHFPGNEEALLFGFQSCDFPTNSAMPKGQGFRLAITHVGDKGKMRFWVELCREPHGNLELFTKMSEDVLQSIVLLGGMDEPRVLRAIISRVTAWQNFMKKGVDFVLSAEEEVGLFGELLFLEELIVAGLTPSVAVNGWLGPEKGLHDFVFNSGGIELKASLNPGGFLAEISSLEQLDDLVINPLFLVAMRLAVRDDGRTLADQVTIVRGCLEHSLSDRLLFENRLLHAGFLDAGETHYSRKYKKRESVILLVDDNFPRLIRSSVPTAIRQVRYQLDLGLVNHKTLSLDDVLALLKVGEQWN